eukprot:6956375-Pyramimonas_sp.AAC.1
METSGRAHDEDEEQPGRDELEGQGATRKRPRPGQRPGRLDHQQGRGRQRLRARGARERQQRDLEARVRRHQGLGQHPTLA